MAKKQEVIDAKKVFTLSSGIQFSVLPVNNILLYDAQQKAKYPDVPLVKIRQGGKDVWTENPSNADYLRRVREIDAQRNMLAMEAIILHGLHLESPLPEDERWLRKIGRTIDLSIYEDDEGEIDPEDVAYLYLRYVGVRNADDYTLISNAVVPTEAEVAEEAEMFSGDEGGDPA